MATAEELIVAIKSEGVGETQDDLESVEQTMEDTASSTGDAAEELGGFSERFAGAASAAVASLAIMSAGILSQVPIIGESFSALGAVIDAFLFRLDGVLRPGLSVINDLLFAFAGAVYEAEGPLGLLADAVSVLVPLIGIGGALIGGIAKVGAIFGVWASTGAGVVSILGTIAGAVATVVGAIASLPVAVLAALAAIVAFAAAYALNLGGIRDKTNRIVGQIVDFVVGGFMSLGTKALNAVTDFAADVRTFFSGLASDLSSWASDLASDAYDWGKVLIQGFINGIRSLISRVQNFLGDLQDVGTSVGIDVSNLGGIGGGGGSGGGGGGSTGRPRFGASSTSGGPTIDGRQISESTGRYRSDPSRRRGL